MKARAPRKGKMRFRELAELALQAKQTRGIRASSIRADRVRLGVLNQVIGHLKISALKARMLAHTLTDLASARRLTQGSFNRYHALLSSIFNYAVREEIIAVNPMADGRVERRPEARIHVRYLERHEQRQLVAVIRRQSPAKIDEVELAILTGMRRSEQWNSRWADWKKAEGLILVDGKTGPRSIPISRAARRCLARMKRRAKAGHLFITPERNVTSVDRRLWFERAVKQAGFASKFGWHGMRHTCASRLAMRNVPLLQIQQILGHASFKTTLKYAHLSPDHGRAAIEKVRF